MEKLRPRAITGLAIGLVAVLRVIKGTRIQLSWGNPTFSGHFHSFLPVADRSICLWPTGPVTLEP